MEILDIPWKFLGKSYVYKRQLTRHENPQESHPHFQSLQRTQLHTCQAVASTTLQILLLDSQIITQQKGEDLIFAVNQWTIFSLDYDFLFIFNKPFIRIINSAVHFIVGFLIPNLILSIVHGRKQTQITAVENYSSITTVHNVHWKIIARFRHEILGNPYQPYRNEIPASNDQGKESWMIRKLAIIQQIQWSQRLRIRV